jgi:hypothetical protein
MRWKMVKSVALARIKPQYLDRLAGMLVSTPTESYPGFIIIIIIIKVTVKLSLCLTN